MATPKLRKVMQHIEEACDRQFAIRVQAVEQEMYRVDKITSETIEGLEEKKRKIRREFDPNAVYSNDDSEIYKYIQCIPKTNSDICNNLKTTNNLYDYRNAVGKYSVCVLDQTLTDIDREISSVQAQHDDIMLDLEKKKHTLRQRLSSIGKLELLINVLTYKIFETQYEHRQEIEALYHEREELMTASNMSDNEVALALAELDRKISDAKNTHEATMMSLEGQRAELRKESAMKAEHMDSMMASLEEQRRQMLKELENHKIGASPAEIEETDRRIVELNQMFLKDVEILKQMQEEGWRGCDSQERISELLEARGLRVTPSGNFLTLSGHHLTRSEASCLGYFEGIDTKSWDSLLKGHRDLGKTESESMLSQDTSTASSESRMASEDIHYLKMVLGKPLTLALAEITAKQPRDPIHYLAHWLLKYRYNQEVDNIKKQEVQELIDERDRLEREKLHVMIEEEARAAILNMVIRAEEEAIRNELERIAREAAMLEAEDEELEQEARDVLGTYDGPPAGK